MVQELTIGDLMEAKEDGQEERLSDLAMKECVEKLLSTLCPRNASIVRALYNLQDEEELPTQHSVTSRHI